jgi:hypothetical protein
LTFSARFRPNVLPFSDFCSELRRLKMSWSVSPAASGTEPLRRFICRRRVAGEGESAPGGVFGVRRLEMLGETDGGLFGWRVEAGGEGVGGEPRWRSVKRVSERTRYG